MKFIRHAQRNLRVRDRVVDVLSKVLLVAVSVLACLWMMSGAHAAPVSITGIKATPQEDGSYHIDFSLSQALPPENVSVDFERNFIQLSLKGVSAYPARTENINQSGMEKVFTYQYQPDLARARVLLKSPASSIKNKSSWEITGQGLRITVKGVAANVGQAITDAVKNKAAANSAVSDTEEERVVQEILNESKQSLAKAAPSATPALAASAERKPAVIAPATEALATGEDTPLFTAKTAAVEAAKGKETTATKIFASLLLVIGVIGAAAVAYRRFALGKGISLGGFPKQPKVIELVASQGLGPKRSIALIKVLDQFLVVGMAGDGMTLLSNLGSDVKIEKFLDQIGPGSSFNEAFEGAMSAGSAKDDTAGAPIAHQVSTELGVRSSIKKRIAGFKPL